MIENFYFDGEKIKFKERSILMVLSGPSGVGKSTLVNFLKENYGENLHFSISATTRKPRGKEKNGVDYIFLAKNEFERRIENNEFLEYALVHDNYYGTLKEQVFPFMEMGKDVILDIDVQGGQTIKKNFNDAVLVFIAPPSIEELKNRLLKRGTDSIQIIEKRLKNAIYEINQAKHYDYILVNDDLSKATKILDCIYKAEKNKVNK